MKQLRNINGPSGMPVSVGERPQVKEMCLRHFLKVATEVAEQIDSRRLFQREGAQE